MGKLLSACHSADWRPLPFGPDRLATRSTQRVGSVLVSRASEERDLVFAGAAGAIATRLRRRRTEGVATAAHSRSAGPTSSHRRGLGSEGHAPEPYAANEFPAATAAQRVTGSINTVEP